MVVTPRSSVFWEDSGRGSMARSDSADDYFGEESDLEEQERLVRHGEEDELDDGRTPLDRTIDRIGMGSYQWTLLSLCGLGWMADNMWIQAIAIILPRVQMHYNVPSSYIGTVSSSMFAGMMFGAVGWGTCSDLMGRITAFNATLLLTAVFGILASLSNSFATLCIALFLLGSSVGGSMPTDGTLLLEHMPKSKQYLVTALSVFFSFGAVLSAVVALLVIPKNSCLSTGAGGGTENCDQSQNMGWKYLLFTLAILTLLMFTARMVFFRLHESPRYLVHAGRPYDAIKSLEMISRFNGSDLCVELDDVRDHLHPHQDADAHAQQQTSGLDQAQLSPTDGTEYQASRPRATSRTIFDATMIQDGRTPPDVLLSRASSAESGGGQRPPLMTAYAATGETPALVDRRRASVYEQKLCWSLPRWLRKPLWAWLDRVMMVLSPEWVRTTVLVWAAWWAMSLAYTMFNVFLPTLLEKGTGEGSMAGLNTGGTPDPRAGIPKSLEQTLWDVVIFTIGGCPGAILGAWLIESPLGRRWSLAGSTFVTALFCVLFAMVQNEWAVRISTVGISLSATAMWAVLYGWTPEIFGTKVRGTACGIASALSRIGGMIAPILGGILLMIDRSFPVYLSVVVFLIAGVCVLLLREDNSREGGAEKGRVAAH
ncbi:MFS general substrate transporter [Coprinopsis marcescibilis]|uniref:MFS general substrate transporter n=1 Tax=Coprinopsis marcescibilis TaxID=230819 RepID=A0A5C3LEG0_COPMA|nr:MFS general substrate transporter [Coprinopsis marcescibilis]